MTATDAARKCGFHDCRLDAIEGKWCVDHSTGWRLRWEKLSPAFPRELTLENSHRELWITFLGFGRGRGPDGWWFGLPGFSKNDPGGFFTNGGRPWRLFYIDRWHGERPEIVVAGWVD